jgi:hypothetical protein
MFEKFTSVDAGDFRQRYQGTYGYFVNEGRRTLTRLDKIHADGRASTVEFVDRDGLSYLLKPDTDKEGRGFEFLPPKSAFFNTEEGEPLLVSRVPARQYLRGICDRNTTVTTILDKALAVDFKTLIRIFETKITPKEALTKALAGKGEHRGVALSPQIAVGLASQQMRVFNHSIGNAGWDSKRELFRVKVDDPDLWRQEVVDAFKRADIGMEFV